MTGMRQSKRTEIASRSTDGSSRRSRSFGIDIAGVCAWEAMAGMDDILPGANSFLGAILSYGAWIEKRYNTKGAGEVQLSFGVGEWR